MRDTTHRGNRREVESVSCVLRKGANAALAKNDLVVALSHDVLRRKQPLVERRGETALEQYRQFRSACPSQEREVLHVARANLDHVAVTFHEIHACFVECFGNDLQPVRFADFCKYSQTFFAETLKSIRRRARLVCAAAEEPRATASDGLGDRE